MEIWRISLLSLLLATTAIAVKGDDVLDIDIDKDETAGVLVRDDSGQGNNEMSWQTAEEIVDAIREFGNVTRKVNLFMSIQSVSRNALYEAYVMFT